MNKKLVLALMGMTAAGFASAATIKISNDITTSATWTSNNVYQLVGQIYVQPGATLTIEPGTLIQSEVADQGSLAVCRGAKIYVNGTKENPVIMTSSNDDLVTWREACNEWGNLTIMGKGLISASHYAGVQVGSNTKTPTGLNEKQMEGLIGGVETYYGGNDDNDDSGSISYLSLRYGGKVIGLANELNGLSLGGIGRETDISHVEIMNNVDDGIEIWGGTVNLKYFSIWNIGDDSLDVDQGWRGKAQFGLIVKGSSDPNGYQGGGIGDNCIEADGAEDSDAQPVTTVALYNMTVIGQPIDGDHGVAYRDNARLQIRNSIFMDLGEDLVKLDNVDGDGGQGYGYNGTLSWADTWTTPYNTYSAVNWSTDVYSDPADMYTAQSAGMLNEIKDSVFYNNQKSSAYTAADAVGVRNAANNNVTAVDMPIVALTRGAPKASGDKTMMLVTFIDPRAANDAVTSVGTAPNDGFFTQAPFRGAFSANNNWLEGWTAAYAYGMTTDSNSADPVATIQMTASTFFPTTAGVLYTVEESSDMKNWAPIATVEGDGSIMSATDLDAFDSAKFYRAIIL